MKNFVCVIAYDGSEYYGWQKTQAGPSIEQTFSDALFSITQKRPKLQAASRTDRGVHARAQVLNFFLDISFSEKKLQHALNAMLPSTIRVYDCFIAKDSFHPTLAAHSKNYRYQVCLGPTQLPFYRKVSYHFPYTIDLQKMRSSATSFLGKKDFISLRNARKDLKDDTICEIFRIDISEICVNRLEFSLHANKFLYKMARNIVGSLLYLGSNKLTSENVLELLEKKDRKLLGITAPAHGLCLHKVFYDEIIHDKP